MTQLNVIVSLSEMYGPFPLGQTREEKGRHSSYHLHLHVLFSVSKCTSLPIEIPHIPEAMSIFCDPVTGPGLKFDHELNMSSGENHINACRDKTNPLHHPRTGWRTLCFENRRDNSVI